METKDYKEWVFEAITDIWTGDAERKGGRLILTGLLGSIRWWFEVLVRGLGGKACDPTDENIRCPEAKRKPTDHAHHCVVCELFGCTGWARKFRLVVLDENDQPIGPETNLRKDMIFKLRFIPLRPIREEEWCLLDLTLRLISNYGAIGGRTVLKPSDEDNRQWASHHADYGLVRLVGLSHTGLSCSKTREELEEYVRKWRSNLKDDSFSWASLANFWYVKNRYLARQNERQSTFNRFVGRDEQKPLKNQKTHKGSREPVLSERDPVNKVDAWLAGSKGESKKVFSFKQPERCTFGFINPKLLNFDVIASKLRRAWEGFRYDELKRGDQILSELIEPRGREKHA